VPHVSKPVLKNVLLLICCAAGAGLWAAAGAWAVDRHLLSDSYFSAAIIFGPPLVAAFAGGAFAARLIRLAFSKYVSGSNNGA
jgi:hypothetical protein